jgi:serine/threonine-protein kinase
MSPEQARGQILDGRSDLFSLGVVLYELLSGTRPFDGSTDAETLLRVTAGQHTPLREVAPEVPEVLVSIVERLLARDREQRFASADACIDAFARFTPNVVCFRELGQLARNARPHQTLSGADLDLELDEPAWPRGSRTETEAVASNTGAPRIRRDSRDVPLTMPSELRSETGRAPGVHRNAWFALGASMLMLLLVGSAWVTHLLQQNEHQPIAQVPPRPLGPADPPAGAAPPPQAEPQINLQPIAGSAPQAPPPAQALPQVHEPPRREPPAHEQPLHESPGREPTVREGREATLDVGVMPAGQIWIDGKLIGWTPQLNLKVRSGRHIVAGGQSSPTIRRSVVLRSGEHKQVMINLEPGASQDE